MHAEYVLLLFIVVVGILLVMKFSMKSLRENNDGSVAMSTAATTWFNGNVDDLVTRGAFTGNLYSDKGLMSEYIIA
jgi:hypothetical protein